MNNIIRESIIVSPSGNLYGSENVLFDFLKGSTRNYAVYVPKGSIFLKKLFKHGFYAESFKSLKWLYIKLFFLLLLSKKNLFLNEAGHINYIKLLAKLLPNRKFVVTIRLLEDCNEKLNVLTDNITLIAVSNYIKSQIETNIEVVVIHDPYELNNLSAKSLKRSNNTQVVIGIVGRIIETKGIGILPELINGLSINNKSKVKVNLYGTFNEESKWFQDFLVRLDEVQGLSYDIIGFIEDQEEIYNNCDLILHLNKVEALGRVIFEAIDYNTEFLCFTQGGAGELAEMLGLSIQTALDLSDLNLKLNRSIENKTSSNINYQNAKSIIMQNFNSSIYASKIETYL